MRRVKKIQLSKTQKFFLVLFFVICVIVRIIVQLSYNKVQRTNIENNAKIYAESVSTSIALSLSRHINSANIMKELYLEYHSNFIKDFSIISKRISDENPQICGMYLAPNAIIQAVYCDNTVSKDIAKSMIGRPVNSVDSIETIKHKSITFAGPQKLLEGGTGFVIRDPIFENDEFSGFSIIVLNRERLINQIIENIPSEQSGYNFAVWTKNNEDEYGNGEGYILKSANIDYTHRIEVPINILNNVWFLTVEPIKGWNTEFSYLFEILATILIIFIPVLSVYFRQRRNAWNMYIAQHDDLTDLLTRTAFYRQTEKIFNLLEDEKFNIVAVDIENFKVNNSMYGTEKCDEVLIYVANRLKKFSVFNLCTRFGSDHFIFIMPYLSLEDDIKELELLATDIMKKAPIETLSIKLGYYGDIDIENPINLSCDKALLAAKSILHNYNEVVANYEGPLSTRIVTSQSLESSFLDALTNNDFKIWFQPKYNAKTEKIIGAEALVRWIKNDGSIVSPGDFISVFEEDGLIYKLDKYIFEKVCTYMQQWGALGYNVVPVSINISRNTLLHKDVIKEYASIVEKTGLKAELIPLEITESSSSGNNRIKDLAKQLKEIGFKIHLDDFGSGFSSLESINLLPFDVIKLDKSLIDYIGTPVGEELLKHTIDLIQFMNLQVIAEGVENEAQLDFLKSYNCDYIQGYYFSAPVPYEKFEEMLKKHNNQLMM